MISSRIMKYLYIFIIFTLLEVASDSNDVKSDCQLLQSYSNKYIVIVKSRIDWLQLFVSMFIDIPQSIPEDHCKLIEVNKIIFNF
jgi:hypothetical protein